MHEVETLSFSLGIPEAHGSWTTLLVRKEGMSQKASKLMMLSAEETLATKPVLSKNTNKLKTHVSRGVSDRRVYACFAKGT